MTYNAEDHELKYRAGTRGLIDFGLPDDGPHCHGQSPLDGREHRRHRTKGDSVTSQRRAPAPAAEPAADEPQDAAEPPPDEPVTPAQLRAIHTVYSRHSVEDRDERLQIAAQIVGRPLASSKDLTKREAGQVIDTLARITDSGQAFTDWLAALYAADGTVSP